MTSRVRAGLRPRHGCALRIDIYLRKAQDADMSNVASRIIAKCGGPKAVAEMCGVDVSRVHRWTYPKSRGGTDGVIPASHQNNLLTKAKLAGINLTPDDFFDLPSETEAA